MTPSLVQVTWELLLPSPPLESHPKLWLVKVYPFARVLLLINNSFVLQRQSERDFSPAGMVLSQAWTLPREHCGRGLPCQQHRSAELLSWGWGAHSLPHSVPSTRGIISLFSPVYKKENRARGGGRWPGGCQSPRPPWKRICFIHQSLAKAGHAMRRGEWGFNEMTGGGCSNAAAEHLLNFSFLSHTFPGIIQF